MSDTSIASVAPLSAKFLAESRVTNFEVGILVPFVITTIFVSARVYSRAIILTLWGLEDTLILFSWVFSTAVLGIEFVKIKHGVGRHIELASPYDLTVILGLAYAVRTLYQLALSTTKLSMCFFYLRIFQDRKCRHLCFLIIGFLVVSTIAVVAAQVFQCIPVQDAWSLSPNAHCPVNFRALMIAGAIINVVGDIALLAFVVPRLVNLQIAKLQKYLLLAVVSTSLLVIIAAIVRITAVNRIIVEPDMTWEFPTIGFWSLLEVNTGIFCASVVAIKPLLRKLWPGFFTNPSDSPNSYYSREKYRISRSCIRRGQGSSSESELNKTPTTGSNLSSSTYDEGIP